MLDREVIADNAEDLTHVAPGMVGVIVDECFEEFIKALRKKAGEYEVNKFTVVASAFKQFANELEQS